MKIRMGLVGAAAAAAVILAAGLWLRDQDWPKHRRLIREGVPSRAFVTAKGVGKPENVHYTYSAEGRLHSGVGRAGFGAPRFEDLEIDDDVLVVYARSDHGVSVLGDPREHIRSQNRVLAALLLLAAPALLACLMRELRSHA